MIAALVLGLIAVGPPAPGETTHQILVMGWDAQTKSCSAKVRGLEVGDPTVKETQVALARLLPDRRRPIELHGSTGVPYACVSALVDAMQSEGYRFQIGAAPESPPLR